MIFSELYSVYYNAVASILRASANRPLTREEMRDIIERHAFGESALAITAALEDGRWPLLRPDGRSVLAHAPTMPLTSLEKSWLNAVAADPRIRLFTDDPPCFPDVKPLFSQDDIILFDRYTDGDDYVDEGYVQRFRLILCAVRDHNPLRIAMVNHRGRSSSFDMMPEKLEYSEKDDKFRLLGIEMKRGRRVVNLGRITECALSDASAKIFPSRGNDDLPEQRTVEFELYDERKALERVLLHFAHFRKEAEKTEEGTYRVKVTFDADDETEMVIRILSFGPMIRVTSPDNFVDLIRQRLIEQKNCGL